MRGFTMIELLIVLVVVAVIVAMTLPAIGRARDVSKDVACRSNLNQIRLAMREYEVRTRHWPRTWDEIELDESSIRFCPAVRERAYPTYMMWMADGDSPRTFDQQVEAMLDPIMVRDAFTPHLGRSNVAFLHAGVKSLGS